MKHLQESHEPQENPSFVLITDPLHESHTLLWYLPPEEQNEY